MDNLIILLKLFKNKPQYLIKFLLENNAFTEDFLTKAFNSTELNRLRTKNEDEDEKNEDDIFSEIPHFKTISSMNEYFRNIINKEDIKEEDNIYEKLNKDLEKNMVEKLKEAIKSENYEEAAVLRDRMKELNIKF